MAKLLRDMTEPELKHYMNLVASATESVMPTGSKFVLLIFDDPGLAQYVSNCDRTNMVQALRECADRLASRQDIPRTWGHDHARKR